MKNNFSSTDFLNKLKRSEPQAISDIVKAYNQTLYNTCLGMGLDNLQSEEVLQNCWQSFFESVHKFEGRSHIRTYIFGILYNKAKEFWRSYKKHSHNDEYDSVIENQFESNGHWKVSPLNPEEFLERSQTMEQIQTCMNGLNEQQRLAFHLKEVVGETSDEICNILGISNTNLRVLIHRAKNRLRVCLESWMKEFNGAKEKI